MRILLATGIENLNKYIIKNFSDLEIVGSLLNPTELLDQIKINNPHKVLLTSDFFENIGNKEKNILKRIVKETSSKVVFIYGNENLEERQLFINFLINIGIYNYTYQEITQTELEDLLYSEKTIDDVKKDLITSNVESESMENADPIVINNVTTIRQKVIGLFGKEGKTVNGLNLAAAIASHYQSLNICYLDLDLLNPSIQNYLKEDVCLSNFKSEISTKKEVVENGNIFSILSTKPFSNISNFKVIRGFNLETYSKIDFDIPNEEIGFIINKLKNYYDILIIDTSGDLLKNKNNRYIFENCNTRLFFLSQDYRSLFLYKNVSKNLNYNNFFLIFNYFENSVIDKKAIKDTLENENIFKISYFSELREIINNEKLLYFSNQNYKNQINKIVEGILEVKLTPQNEKKKISIKNILKRRIK